MWEGWYGDGDQYHEGHPLKKSPVNCRELWGKCLKIAGKTFIENCDGISGSIGSLKEDGDFNNEPMSIPIDTLVVDLTRDKDEFAELGTVENV